MSAAGSTVNLAGVAIPRDHVLRATAGALDVLAQNPDPDADTWATVQAVHQIVTACARMLATARQGVPQPVSNFGDPRRGLNVAESMLRRAGDRIAEAWTDAARNPVHNPPEQEKAA